ncbi:MAG: hypothetical protein JJ964_15390 [Rhizobiales bacterium]|nr:hypothetical protein [Hyphomicrobiales bacterium]
MSEEQITKSIFADLVGEISGVIEKVEQVEACKTKEDLVALVDGWELEKTALQARIKELEAQQVCRPEVLAFATEMERVLKTNDYKGGWKHCDLTYLKRRLTQERGEFERALARYRADPEHEQSKHAVLDEACDVANFLMMTCDVIGALTPPTKEGGRE